VRATQTNAEATPVAEADGLSPSITGQTPRGNGGLVENGSPGQQIFSPSRQMTDRQTRATCWSLTINNPTKSDEEWIQQARQKGWQVEGQKEVGAEGTEH